ncbi:MAG: hypothetical protein NT013_00385 [Planctomycetia bacterium]|nr:hypothetical protein [Planctomycetia bacterium]
MPRSQVWTGTVNYGDGGGNEPLTINQMARTFDLDHTYTTDGAKTITVTINDGDAGGTLTDSYVVTVTLNTAPEIAPQSFNANENQTAVGTVVATDADLPSDTQTFSITGAVGLDNGLFTITSAGVLSFTAAPDFENPTDVGGTAGDNVYLVEVQIRDTAGATDTAIMSVTVNDLQAILSINDVSIVEGNSGTTPLNFTVSVTGDSINVPFDVSFGTADGTATQADGDYSSGSFSGGGLVFGGVDAARGGATSMANGSLMTNIRADISANSPGATFTSANTLTPAYLDTIDVLFVSSWPTVVTLSAAEQAAVLDFVEDGGGAIIWGENDTWTGGADNSNESLIDPFQMDITGTLGGGQTVTVTNPGAHVVTAGPFGTVNSFGLSYPGWFNNLGPYATTLGTLNANGQSALAVINPGAINAGSGGVVLISDGNGTSGAPQVRTLILNSLSFVASDPNSLSFSGSAGETQSIGISVNGDLKVELNESMIVNLTSVVGTNDVTILDGTGDGTIENDDSATVSIGNASVTEGGNLAFTVTLSKAVDVPTVITYSTANGSATTADSDYAGQTAQTLTIPAGQTSGTITIATTADNKVELNESLTVNLSAVAASGRAVTILDGTGDGTIRSSTTTRQRSPSATHQSPKAATCCLTCR